MFPKPHPFVLLPPELQDLIVGYLSTANLLSVCLSSRQLKPLAERRLLETVEVAVDRSLLNFVSRLTPIRAACVRTLKVLPLKSPARPGSLCPGCPICMGSIRVTMFPSEASSACWRHYLFQSALDKLLRETAPVLTSLTYEVGDSRAFDRTLNYPHLLSVTASCRDPNEHARFESGAASFLARHPRVRDIEMPTPPTSLSYHSNMLYCPLHWAVTLVEATNISPTTMSLKVPTNPGQDITTLALRPARSRLTEQLECLLLFGESDDTLRCLEAFTRHSRVLKTISIIVTSDRFDFADLIKILDGKELTRFSLGGKRLKFENVNQAVLNQLPFKHLDIGPTKYSRSTTGRFIIVTGRKFTSGDTSG
ncbi:hypothetical protein C8F04DRAFT_1140852 [Mycena alexandri]|uniref:F-box domain-containing protein n=1 Tax=Mycena alexandri TaxID=1745969 RepID=A0AAD6S5Y2_9AGAR|nr:hypothetical protein C8F04DRAFT_1140852 [Mycena alexandri]